MSPPPVAVAVVSWNTRELLRACLASLARDAESGLAEVWVVDNASTDGSAQAARDEFPWARLCALDDNLGFGRAVNLVARRSASPWVAPANADLEFEPGAIARLLHTAEAWPRLGAVGPRLVLRDGSVQPSVQPFPTVANTALLHSRLFRLDRRIGERLCLPGYWSAPEPRAVDWVTGAFMLVRREAFDAVGGFDDEQWMYAEDMDLCWRLRRAGWEVAYDPGATVHHVVSAAADQAFGPDVTDRWTAATYAWMLARRGAVPTRATALLNIAGGLARAGALRLAEAVRPRRFEGRWREALVDARSHRVGLEGRRALLARR
jgi:N-acetylglucosaminyl-diphospho-decaprenol L-rhamnosyltransferase